jgi:hypothetical protein
MKTKKIAYLIMAVYTALFTIQIKGQNLITNGDFELPQYSAPPYYRYLPAGDNTDLLGWTSIDDGIGEQPYVINTNGYPDNIYSGSQSVTLDQGSGISTTFSVSAGTVYLLSFYTRPAVHYQSFSSLAPLHVSVGGYATTFYTTNQETFTQFTYEFIAPVTNTAAALEFYNPSSVGDFKVYLVDDVIVSVVTNPAPQLQLDLAGNLMLNAPIGSSNRVEYVSDLGYSGDFMATKAEHLVKT